jgi:hypothetical protein
VNRGKKRRKKKDLTMSVGQGCKVEATNIAEYALEQGTYMMKNLGLGISEWLQTINEMA